MFEPWKRYVLKWPGRPDESITTFDVDDHTDVVGFSCQAYACLWARRSDGKAHGEPWRLESAVAPVSDDSRPVLTREIHATLCVDGRTIDLGSGVSADELSIEPATLEPQSEVITDKPPAPPLWHDEPGELDRLRRYFATKWRSDDFA